MDGVMSPVLVALPTIKKCPELSYEEDCDLDGVVRGEEDCGGDHLPVGVFLGDVTSLRVPGVRASLAYFFDF